MDSFILKAKNKLKENQNPFSIPGLKNNLGEQLSDNDMTPPTIPSVRTGYLEWIIPNNVYNQNHINTHYSNEDEYEIISLNDRAVTKMKGMPDLPETDTEKKLKTETKGKKLPPKVAQQLKSDLMDQLIELGIKVPERSTIKDMQVLLEAAAA